MAAGPKAAYGRLAMPRRLLLALLAAAVTVGAFAAPPAMAGTGATVKVKRTSYGRILVDSRGFALYLFTRDPKGKSRCYDACAEAWPPLVVTGDPSGGSGAKDSLVSTTKRKGGASQVTYAGRPLYYYVGDRSPGQVLCQDVFEFGGTWLVVKPDGTPVR